MTRIALGGRPMVALDDDCCSPTPPCSPAPLDPPDVGPEPERRFEIRLRARTGFDEDGAPLFDWTPIGVARAISVTERQEVDAEAGITLVQAQAMFSRDDALDALPETAVVVEQVGDVEHQWRVTSSRVIGDRVEVHLERVESTDPTGGA